jgi:hypothetical protein
MIKLGLYFRWLEQDKIFTKRYKFSFNNNTDLIARVSPNVHYSGLQFTGDRSQCICGSIFIKTILTKTPKDDQNLRNPALCDYFLIHLQTEYNDGV